MHFIGESPLNLTVYLLREGIRGCRRDRTAPTQLSESVRCTALVTSVGSLEDMEPTLILHILYTVE